MFKLAVKIPRSVYVAVSGGPDSMAVIDFLRRSHNVTAIHFNHGTDHGKEAEKFVVDIMRKMGISLIVGRIEKNIETGKSLEEFWRNERYEFFKQKVGENPLITAHTLDDAMETWIFSSLHGMPKLIPVKNGNVLRPFLLSRKRSMLEWCERKEVPFILDPGNMDLDFPRARIRNVIIPELLKINPGFPKVIAKKYMSNKTQSRSQFAVEGKVHGEEHEQT